MASASDIRTALLDKLGEVTELKQVKLGHTSDFSEGFPACRVYLVGTLNPLIDNQPTYERTYQYGIEIIQKHKDGSEATDEAAFEDAIDAVLDKLGAEWTLDDNVHVLVSNVGQVRPMDSQIGPSVSCIITVEAKTSV